MVVPESRAIDRARKALSIYLDGETLAQLEAARSRLETDMGVPVSMNKVVIRSIRAGLGAKDKQ